MAVPTYSSRLFFADPLTAPLVEFGPVPDGYIWVLRDIVMSNSAVLPITTSGILIANLDGAIVATVPQFLAYPGMIDHWRGRQVFEPGDSGAIVAPDYGNWAVQIMGYVLTSP